MEQPNHPTSLPNALIDNGLPYPPGTVPVLSGGGDNIVMRPTPSDDPEDPLNWKPWRKGLNFGLLMAVTTVIFTELLVQNVIWPLMVSEINDVTFTTITQGGALQLAGLALGCIFFVPFAKKFGRRSVYIASTTALAAVTWWSSRLTTGAEVYLTNFFIGLAASINETAVQLTIEDLFFIHQRATANGIYFAAVCTGSYLTPIIAGKVAEQQGWRTAYYSLAICLTALAAIFLVSFEETKFVREPYGQDMNSSMPHDVESLKPSVTVESHAPERTDSAAVGQKRLPTSVVWRYLHRMRLITPTDESLWKTACMPLHTITLPHVMFTSLQFGCGVTSLVVLGAMIGVVFSAPPYNFTSAGIGYMFVGSMVGTVFGSLYGGPLVDWFALRSARRNNGLFEPEMRIILYHAPALFLAGGLIMFGMTADRGMHWIYPSIGTAFYAFGFGAIGDMAFTLVIDASPGLVAESFVTVAFFRNALSIVGAFCLAPWREVMSVSNIFITMGCISLAINLLYIPMLIWGKRMREHIAPRYYQLCRKAADNR